MFRSSSSRKWEFLKNHHLLHRQVRRANYRRRKMAEKSEKPLHPMAVFAALLVMLAWLALLLRLVLIAGSAEEKEWVRLFAVLSSLEAVAFGAAGALFGTTIQRQRVEEARSRADKA